MKESAAPVRNRAVACASSRPSAATHASRRLAQAVLAFALILGAGLRFYKLGDADLSADEAAAWAAAAAPIASAVIERQRSLDPGKLALYDLVLHGWIAISGDGVGSMRALSAVLGTVVIVLAFATTRELLLVTGGEEDLRVELAAAFASLVVAANLALVDQARTVRMYPLTLALELGQVICFLRAASTRTQGLDRIASFVGAAVFAAMAIAANFTAALLASAEVVWLAWVALCRRAGARDKLHMLVPAIALCVAFALLLPFVSMASQVSIAVVHAGVLNWSHLRPPWWPIAMLRSASGKAPFLLLLPLGMYGGWRMRRGGALGFLTSWILAPITLVMVVSYGFTPFEETRYVIGSVTAFFILAAIGLASIEDEKWRFGILVLLMLLSLDHVRRDFSKPRYVQWRAASVVARNSLSGGDKIVVTPAYAVNVVRYYLPVELRDKAVPIRAGCELQERVLVLGGMELQTPAELAALRACNPVLVQRLRLLEVRKR